MKTLMITTAAALALTTSAFAQVATTEPLATEPLATETMPVETMPVETVTPMDTTAEVTDIDAVVVMSDVNPGISAEWFEGKAIYTTNEPSTTMWDDEADWGTALPGDWNQIAEVSDVVLSGDGQVMGYIADIGGFLGLGERTVMLSPDVLNLVDFDDAVLWGDDTVFATNYTQEELEALPEVEMDYILE